MISCSEGSYSVVLNVANDNLVQAFLNEKIKFIDIPILIELALESHPVLNHPNLDDITELTEWTKQFINRKIDL
mgnify:CR=1 FL=1